MAFISTYLGEGFWTGVLSGAFLALVMFLFKKGYEKLKNYKNSPYSGKWEDDIFEDDTKQKIVKKDEYIIQHNKRDNTLTGSIRRILPVEQKHREWKMQGVINGNYLIIVFWASPMQKSNGCIYAKLSGDYEYSGYYLEEYEGIIDKTPIRLRKKDMKNS